MNSLFSLVRRKKETAFTKSVILNKNDVYMAINVFRMC